MKDRFNEEPKYTRRDVLNDVKFFGAVIAGMLAGKLLTDAQYSETLKRLSELETEQKAMQVQEMIDKQQQQGINNILVNRVYQLGEKK